jgi:cyanate permease
MSGGGGRAVAGAFALGTATGAAVLNVAAIPDEIAAAYGVGLATVGVFTTVLLVCHAGVQLPGGGAIDRFGARSVGLFAIVVMAASNAAALAAPEPALALVARAISGIGSGVGFIAGSDYIRATGGSAIVQGAYGGIGMGGAGLALALVPQLEPSAGWRAPFFFVVAIASAALVAWLLGPRDVVRPQPAGTAAGAVLRLAADRSLVRLGVLHVASTGFGLLVGAWVVALLVRQDISQSAAGAIGGLTLIVTMAARPLGGWIVQHRPGWVRTAVAASLLAGGLGCAGLAVGSTAVAVVAAIAVGIGSGLAFAALFTGAVRLRPDAPGAAIGVVNMYGTLAALAATPVLGLAFSLPGEGRIGFLAVAALWAASALAVPKADQLGLAPEPLPSGAAAR